MTIPPMKLVSSLILFLCVWSLHVRGSQPPNVIFILADDLGINDLGCYGRAEHHTPHLDALAQRGARFTSAYCAQPICSPSRAAILSCKAPARLGLTTYLPGRPDAPAQMLRHPEIPMQLALEEKTLAEYFNEAGYHTAAIGKWHLGNSGFAPADQGFEFVETGKPNTEPSDTEGGKGEFHLTRTAISFIEKNRDKPFFVYLAHNTPHIPFKARADLVEKHKGAYQPTYAGVIESMDASVGLLLQRVEELGLNENTIVIFTSDNGGLHVLEGKIQPATRNTPFRAGKGYVYEGGLRIPLIVSWPGRVPNRVVDAPVMNTGWIPTLLDLCGLKPQMPVAGDTPSFAPLLRGDAETAEGDFCWHFPHYTNQGSRPAGAIRVGNLKLIEHFEDGRMELFDLAKDVSETTDISALQPAKVAELRGKLELWRRKMGAKSNTGNASFRHALWRPIYGALDTSNLPPQTNAEMLGAQLADWRKLMDAALVRKAASELSKRQWIPATGGVVLLHARDAVVHGQKLRYEDPPHKDTIGFWTVASDWAEWKFRAQAGTFHVQLLAGCGKGSEGSSVEITISRGDEVLATLPYVVEGTGHFQRFVPREIGAVNLPTSGEYQLAVRAVQKKGAAVMDLRRVTLFAE